MSEEQNILPEGWKMVKLGDVVTYSKGKKPKILCDDIKKGCDIPYINIKAFEKGVYTQFTNGDKCNLCNDGDLLMVWDGARSGLTGKAKKGAVGSTLMKIDPIKVIHKEYLYNFLLSVYKLINTNPRGVGIPHVEPKLLWNLELVLPPLPTQQAIVAKIEELFSELDNGIANLTAAQQQLDTYRQSVLKWAFEGRLTNDDVQDGELPEGWEWVKLDDLCESVRNGYSKKPDDVGDKRILRISSVRPLDLNTNDYRLLLEDLGEKELIKENDLLFTRYNGSRDYVGVCAMVPKLTTNYYYPDKLIRCRLLKNDTIHAKYIMYAVNQGLPRKYIVSRIKTTAGQSGISGTEIKKTKIPICSLKEQEQVVQEIESRLSVADKLQETITESLNKATSLRQSILKQAFEGKLVANTEVKNVTKELRVIEGISTTDLHAAIISLTIQAHENSAKHADKLSHVKCEKIADLVERKIGISLGRNAVKDAAGPDDYSHLKKVEHRARMQNFFTIKPQPVGHSYKSSRNLSLIINKAKATLQENDLSDVEKLISTFLPFELEHAELVATIFAGWNNLIIQGKPVTEEDIVYESRENWSERKMKIPREHFFKTLTWMKTHNYIPDGRGELVSKPAPRKLRSKKMK